MRTRRQAAAWSARTRRFAMVCWRSRRKGLGMTAIVDGERRVLGVFTDGDLRRALDQPGDFRTRRMGELMTAQSENDRAATPRRRSRAPHGDASITALLVVDEHNALVGALNVHDLLRAGVM